MGISLSSCCRRRRRHPKLTYNTQDEERQPLLQNIDSTSDTNAGPSARSRTVKQTKARNALEHLSAVLFALSAGRLPSQNQLNEVILRILGSGLLDANTTIDQHLVASIGLGSANARGDQRTEANNKDFSKDADQLVNKIVLDARFFLETIMRFGLEKNDDDIIQDILYHLKVLKLSPPQSTDSTPTSYADGSPASLLLVPISSFLPLLTSQSLRTNLLSLTLTLLSFPTLSNVSSVASNITSTAIQISEKVDDVKRSAEVAQDVAGTIGGVAGMVSNAAGIAVNLVEGVEEVAEEIGRVVDGVEGEFTEPVVPAHVEASFTSNEDNVIEGSPINSPSVPKETKNLEDEKKQPISPNVTSSDDSTSTKNAFLSQLESLFIEAHKHENDLATLRILLDLMTQYTAFAQSMLLAAEQGIEDSELGSSINITKTKRATHLDPILREVLNKIKILLSRIAFANANSSHIIDRIADTFTRILSTLSTSEGHPGPSAEYSLRALFTRLHMYLTSSLSPYTPDYACSPKGRHVASQIYDSFDNLFSLEESVLARDTRLLAKLIESLMNAIKKDHATFNLYSSAKILYNDLCHYTQFFLHSGPNISKPKHGTVYNTLVQICISIFPSVSRQVIRALRRRATILIPMPRVEYVSKNGSIVSDNRDVEAQKLYAEDEVDVEVSAAIDALMLHLSLESGSDAEDGDDGDLKIRVINYSDFTIDAFPKESQGNSLPSLSLPSILPNLPFSNASTSSITSNKTHTQVHIHTTLPNFHLQVQDVAYFAKYWKRPRWLHWTRSLFCGMCQFGYGYEDEGLLNIDIGGEGKDMAVLNLEINVDTSEGTSHKSYTTNSKLSLPSITFRLQNTAHPVINSLLVRPFGGPLVRTFVESYIQSQIESVSNIIVGDVLKLFDAAAVVARTHSEDKEISWMDILRAIAQTSFPHTSEVGDEEENEESEQQTESHTKVSIKGLIHTSVVTTDGQITSPTSGLQAEEEYAASSIAIGIAPQLLPSKAEPTSLAKSVSPIPPSTDQVVNAVSSAAHDMLESAEETAHTVRSEMGHVRQSLKEGKKREERQEGWRSQAFDLQSSH